MDGAWFQKRSYYAKIILGVAVRLDSFIEGPKGEGHEPKTKTIYWNPKQGIVTTNGTKLSPASALNHEADHAADAIQNPAAQLL